MAFGFTSKPTRKYSYGVREKPCGSKEPFPGHAVALEQLRLAAKFQNKLVELELARRNDCNRIVLESHTDLPRLLEAAELRSQEVEDLRTELKERNSANRRVASDQDLITRIQEARRIAAAAWDAYQALRQEQFADEGVRELLRANDGDYLDRKAQARSDAVVAGLYWGTAAHVMTRVKTTGMPPRFKRFNGEGLLAVQIQRKPDTSTEKQPVLDSAGNPRIHPRSGKPMTRYVGNKAFRAESLLGDNNMVRIRRITLKEWWDAQPKATRTSDPPPDAETTCHPHYVNVWLRIASTEEGSPVWVVLPTHLSRPLPPEAEIKWVYLRCVKIGTRRKWEVQFDLAQDAWPRANGRKQAESGAVGVALGWRLIDGAVRVAYWVGTDGEEGDITIPVEYVNRWRYCEELQGKRDKLFDRNRAVLVAWLATNPAVPEWFQKRVAGLPQWRSANRLSDLIVEWRNKRFEGDEPVFTSLEGRLVGDRYTGGRKQDKHLYDWAESQRTNNRNWRKQFFQEIALKLAVKYKNCFVEEIDWAELGENPPPEEADEDVNKLNRGIAAVAMLRNSLTNLMDHTRVDAHGVVVDCCVCNHRCPDPGRGRWIVCEPCGDGRRDRLQNAAKNLLQRGLRQLRGETTPRSPQPPKPKGVKKKADKKTKAK